MRYEKPGTYGPGFSYQLFFIKSIPHSLLRILHVLHLAFKVLAFE